MKIRLGIPTGNGKLFPKTELMVRELMDSTLLDIEPVIVPGYNVSVGRNMCITKGQQVLHPDLDFDYYMSADSDMYFTDRQIADMAILNPWVMSMKYRRRTYTDKPPEICGGYWDKGKPGYPDCIKDFSLKGIQHVSWVGMGACLIHQNVFTQMKFPYFKNEYLTDGENCFYMGDDVALCIELNRLAIPILLNCDIEAEHLTDHSEQAYG